MSTFRWNPPISPDIDQPARVYMLDRAVAQAKEATFNLGEEEIADLIDEAVQWSRHH